MRLSENIIVNNTGQAIHTMSVIGRVTERLMVVLQNGQWSVPTAKLFAVRVVRAIRENRPFVAITDLIVRHARPLPRRL